MSAPVRGFERLTIDTSMPTTRGQERRQSSGNLPSQERAPRTGGDVSAEAEPSAVAGSQHPRSSNIGIRIGESQSPESLARSPLVDTATLKARGLVVRDILSTIERDLFPSEFRPDVFERIDIAQSPEDCFQNGDISGTFFRLAVNAEPVFDCLREARPADARAKYFNEKLRRRIREQLRAFDAISDEPSGPLTQYRAESIRSSVASIAAELRQIVEISRVDRISRQHEADGTASCLTMLLQEVCNRNHDATSQVGSGRRAIRVGGGAGNLFQVLIGNAPADEAFVLDALEMLPQDVLGRHAEALEKIRSDLVKYRAPVVYRRRLDEIAGKPQMEGSPRPGQKRAAGGNGGGDQKKPK